MKNLGVKRFIYAQEQDHDIVIRELSKGVKQSCWMWYTFPQICGLGYSPIAKYYEFTCMGEVRAFAANIFLYSNIVECMETLLELRQTDAIAIFGPIDAQKLKSSMTVLRTTQQLRGLADAVLDKFFDGELDNRTIAIIKSMEDR